MSMVERPGPPLQLPELPVLARALIAGFALAELARLAMILGSRSAPLFEGLDGRAVVLGVALILSLLLSYFWLRGGWQSAVRLLRSKRADVLLALAMGALANELSAPLLVKLHTRIESAGPWWAPLTLAVLLLGLATPLARRWLRGREPEAPPAMFLTDEAIELDELDELGVAEQARHFAESVMESAAQPGLVFGIDGAWGAGKTSFVNLAGRHWREMAGGELVVARFEPLRFAGEADLTDRLIKEVSAQIQERVFAPEIAPAASRYARMLKGKADLSFLGFSLSLEPGTETAEERLDAIDEILRRLGRRVVIVVDDLDRLEPAAVNSVLFAVRRAFNLRRATYILCYDTEVLTSARPGFELAREFIEKFVGLKVSLMAEPAKLRHFLRRDWQESRNLALVPAERLAALGPPLGELAAALEGPNAARYVALMGDMRKIKRFINALLLARLDSPRVWRSDFHARDLVHLLLLHLSFPGAFRHVHAEEADAHGGVFSVRRGGEDRAQFVNSDGFEAAFVNWPVLAQFLIRELFDVATLRLGTREEVEEQAWRTRACFNEGGSQNLRKYLDLILRLRVPEPRETYAMYRDAVTRVKSGEPTKYVLSEAEFDLSDGGRSREEFWRVLVSEARSLSRQTASEAIETLLNSLPGLSSLESGGGAPRQGAIFTLARLLDRAGHAPTEAGRYPAQGTTIEIAQRIFGEGRYEGRGIIGRLSEPGRGALGWHDLALFRLICSADRQGQLDNLRTALLLDQDSQAPIGGQLQQLALRSMRRISQEVFKKFDAEWIAPGRNYLAEVDSTAPEDFAGEGGAAIAPSQRQLVASDLLAASRSSVKTFVLYQLSNSDPPKGAGVGCGFYDEEGDADGGGIAVRMNAYAFGSCFDLERDPKNRILFADHSLSNLSRGFRSDEGGEWQATAEGIAAGFSREALAAYWRANRDAYLDLPQMDRRVVTHNYVATYGEHLPRAIAALDALIE